MSWRDFTPQAYFNALVANGDFKTIRDLTAKGFFSDVDKGILPLNARQVSQSNVLEKSIELESHHLWTQIMSQKYAQYQVKQYVDIKRRDPWLWNLVGNGKSYPTVYEGGEVMRAGCGFLWKDEGLGCLNVEAHEGHYAKVKLMTNKCMRPQCPVDYMFWAAREASRIEERFRRVPKLSTVEEITAEARTQMGVPIHLMISVPECDAELMDLITLEVKRARGRNPGKYDQYQTELIKVNHFNKMAEKVAKIAKMVDFKAGCMIFHPFANDELDEDDPGVQVSVDPHSGKVNVKELKAYMERVYARASKPGEPVKEAKLWYIRPHFHLIGYGWIKNVEQVYRKTGYVIKNLGVRDSVFLTALYQLSHAGYREGQHTVRWIGKMSNRLYKDLDPLPELPKTMPKCPECGEELRPVRWVGEGISPLDHVSEEGFYFTDPAGWEYIPDEIVHAIYDQYDRLVQPERVIRAPGYRGRIVKPTDEEKEERHKRMLEVSRAG